MKGAFQKRGKGVELKLAPGRCLNQMVQSLEGDHQRLTGRGWGRVLLKHMWSSSAEYDMGVV